VSYIEDYYNTHDEDSRLLSRRGSVEYVTTMKYIHACLEGLASPSVLEVGAGTGRYSVTLSREGFSVTAVELVPHNIEVLKSKLTGEEPIKVMQGNALDLGFLPDSSFDVTLLLGPMYHLYTREDKLRALSEAVRVTKPGGFILVAYCMNESTIIQYVFMEGRLREVMEADLIDDAWHCKSEPKELFELIRTEEIASLDAELPVERLKLVATDGASHYLSGLLEAMDELTFAKWLEYHLSVCERQDLVGASNHTLDVLRKL
jgi:SAM-dependent methyltransferase